MDERKLQRTIQHVLTLLVQGDYEALERLTGGARLPADALRREVQEWPAQIIMPPSSELATLLHDSIYEIEGVSPRRYAVDLDLWTVEEGRSDLTLSLTLIEAPGDYYLVQIDNLHVL